MIYGSFAVDLNSRALPDNAISTKLELDAKRECLDQCNKVGFRYGACRGQNGLYVRNGFCARLGRKCTCYN